MFVFKVLCLRMTDFAQTNYFTSDFSAQYCTIYLDVRRNIICLDDRDLLHHMLPSIIVVYEDIDRLPVRVADLDVLAVLVEPVLDDVILLLLLCDRVVYHQLSRGVVMLQPGIF